MEPVKLQSTLKRLMEERQISIRSLSKKTGVPHTTISFWLRRGGGGKPEHIRAVARFFGVSMETLLFGEDAQAITFENVATQEMFEGWLHVVIKKAIRGKKRGEDL